MSRKPTTPPTKAQTLLLSAGEVGSGYNATTKVDASIPSLCGSAAPDSLKRAESEAQIGFFSPADRLLVTEKVSTYAEESTAAQIDSLLLNFDSCGSKASYDGQKATFGHPRDLPAAVMTSVDSGAARDLKTARVNVTFESIRRGSTLVQLTFTSIGATPAKAVVDQLTTKAAAKLS